jgi:hypothetical protein
MKTSEKSFDCVKMTRDIRDGLYEKYSKGKTLKEFGETLAREARKSPLWKGLDIKNKK